MSDEPDALLMRRFAESRRPLQDARFVAAVGARLPRYPLGRALGAALGGILRPLRREQSVAPRDRLQRGR